MEILMRIVALVGLMLYVAASGCSSAKKPAGLGQAVSDYNAGRYAEAHQAANAAMSQTAGPVKDDAAYLAGMSAYQMGDADDAERRWTVAAKSSNDLTAAK